MTNYMILGKHPVIEAIKSNSKKLLKVYVLEQNIKTVSYTHLTLPTTD